MGLFNKDKKEKADFSDVQSGSTTNAPRQSHERSLSGATYTVKSGDTLSAIAQRELGDASAWRRIYEANRDQIEDPDMIHPGQRLTIPGRSDEGGFR